MNTTIQTHNAHDQTSAPDRMFKLVKTAVQYGFGFLWWGRDDLIKKKQPTFVERTDRIGHPLLSIKQDDFQSRFDPVPMLVGTSSFHVSKKRQRLCVSVAALNRNEPDRICCFGTIVEPGFYDFDDILDGVIRKTDPSLRNNLTDEDKYPSDQRHWYYVRRMCPNTDKPHVNPDEERELDMFCERNHLKRK